jgi:hypothetical protein
VGESVRSYLFLGDTHGDLHLAKQSAIFAAEHGAEIIQVGDWGYLWPGKDKTSELSEIMNRSGVNMRFIDGNHDEHPALAALSIPHVIYQPRGSVYEDTDGTRFLFCGGAASIDRDIRVLGRSWWPEETITESEFALAMDAAGPIHVLVTHDAPDYPPGFRPAGDPGFRKRSARSMEMVAALIDGHRPALHVHGHWHHLYSMRRGSTRVVGLDCNGAGLARATLLWSR